MQCRVSRVGLASAEERLRHGIWFRNSFRREHACAHSRAHTHTHAPMGAGTHTCRRTHMHTGLQLERAHAYPHWSANSLRRRAIALRRSRRLCAAFGTTASRWSRIGRIDGHTAPTCARPSVLTDTDGKQTACAVASSLSDTFADCARQPAYSRRRFSTAENQSRRPPTPLSSVVSHSFFLERHTALIRPTQYGTRPITLKRFTNLDLTSSSRLFTQVRVTVTVTVTVSWHETPGPWPPMRRAARRAGDAARWHITWPLLALGSRGSD